MKLRDLLKAVPAFLAEQEDGPSNTLPPSPTGVLRGLGVTLEPAALDPGTQRLRSDLPRTVELYRDDFSDPEITVSEGPSIPDTAPRTPSAPPPVDPATHLGRYELGTELGRGGMGRVVEAADPEIGRTVAIKVLLDPQRVSDETLARFVAEARVTGQLQHPNIVPVYEMGVTDAGQFYFVMKRVEGRSLLEIVRDLRRKVPEVVAEWTTHRLLTAFVQVCNAVAYAHDRRLLHRDLKPDNVMLGRFGEVLVMDWGIARIMGPGTDGPRSLRASFDSRVSPPESDGDGAAPVHPAVAVRTQAGATFGTPGYMSPEQSAGRMDELDERSDVWSLGSILFQLLTLSRAFGHRDPQKLMRIAATKTPPDPRTRGTYVADEVAEICMRAMAKAPEDRWPTADALGKAVRAYLDGSLARDKAGVHLVDARRAWSRYLDIQAEARDLERRQEALERSTAAWAPLEEKNDLIAVRMRREAEGPMSMEAFGDVVAASEQVLTLDPRNEEARELLALAFRARFEEAEEHDDAASRRYYRARLRAFDDGRHEAALLEGGYLTLHTDPPGAAAYVARIDRRNLEWTVGEEEYLGLTPLQNVSLPVGSHRVRLVHGGKRDTMYPVRIRRGGHWSSGARPVPLFDDSTIGEGFVYVPRGPFEKGGERTGGVGPRHVAVAEGFFVAVHPVTMAEYAMFLTELHRADPDAAWARVPRQESGFRTAGGQYWPRPPVGAAYYLPDEDRDGDVWDALWPVFAVSWDDATAYAAWAGAADDVSYTLPTEQQWEKVARGVDGRVHPWGDIFDAALCKMRDSQPGRPFPEPVGAFAGDVSIYGVHDLGGSAREWCADVHYNGDPERRPVRGGGWDSGAAQTRASYRTGFHQWRVVTDVGFRLVRALPSAGSTEEES